MNLIGGAGSVRQLDIDTGYLTGILKRLLETPSPSGYTDAVVRLVCAELDTLGIDYELTRRGAIRASLEGRRRSPDRAVIAHLDTLGGMVKALKGNGRLAVVPIGTWSPRFAEGARVTIFRDNGDHARGTILPLKASGHVYNKEIDSQPVTWENLEIRIDEIVQDKADLERGGFNIGDFVAVDSTPEFSASGFVNARHLDDKAGVAAVLAAAKALVEAKAHLALDCHLLFTISEEVGVGASAVLHGDVAEIVSVDNGTIAPGQNTSEYGVTVVMQDSSGPFDWHLTHKLIDLCNEHQVEHSRDIFRYYRSDAAAAVEAGNDIRTALLCFALDASHGYERTHLKSLAGLAELLALYIQSGPVVARDKQELGPLEGLPEQPV